MKRDSCLKIGAKKLVVSEGFYVGRPTVIHDGGHNLLVVKPIGKRLSSVAAEQLASDIEMYWHMLRERGVPVPSFLQTKAYPYPRSTQDGWRVTEVSSFCGESLRSYFEGASVKECLEIVRQLTFILTGLFPNSNDFTLNLTIDPVLSNFARNETGRISYIDFIPPRLSTKDRTLVAFPSSRKIPKKDWDFLRFRHLDARGLIIIFLAQTSRIRPELRPQFLRLLLEDLPQPLAAFLASLPTQRLVESKNSAEKARIIDQLKPEDADLARDMACALIPRGGVDLQSVFRLSHVEFHPPASSDMAAIKRVLKRHL